MREIEPTLIEQIRPTTLFFPEILSTPTVEKAPKIIEKKKEEVKVAKVNEVPEPIKKVKEESQKVFIPEVKEVKPKTAKALFQEEKVVPVTEPVSYEYEEDDEDEEDNLTEEPGT